MAGKHKSWILPGIVGLTCGLFALDLFMPLGVAIGALYAGIVLLASFSPVLPMCAKWLKHTKRQTQASIWWKESVICA